MVSSNFRQNLHDIVLNQCQPHQFENMGNNNEPHVLENKEGEENGWQIGKDVLQNQIQKFDSHSFF
jgi:hypothetical protein